LATNRNPSTPGYTTANSTAIDFNSANGLAENILVEDCFMRFFTLAILFQGNLSGMAIKGLRIRRNIVLDCWSVSGRGHSQGLFFRGVNDAVIEENFFDSCGWLGDRDNGITDINGNQIASQATQFNRSIYASGLNPLSSGNTVNNINNFILRGNVIARDSTGIQMRMGGTAENNLFIRCPIIRFGDQNIEWYPQGVDCLVRNNVNVEANDTNAKHPAGTGFAFQNARTASVVGNIVSSAVGSNQFGASLWSAAPSSVSFERNTFWKVWRGYPANRGFNGNLSHSRNYYYDAPQEMLIGNEKSEDANFSDPDRLPWHRDNLSREQLLARMRARKRLQWNSLNAAELNDYMRAGFQ
jgi:hypothetical protein